MKGVFMKRGSTLILRGVIILIGVIVLATCIFALPEGIRTDEVGGYRWILLGLYVPAVPFFIALYQTMKLLNYIDKNNAFSGLSIRALKTIKYCAITISLLFAAGMPYIYTVADRDDAPGVILLGLIVVFASGVIATAAAVLQQLVRSAVDIKSENDLTV
jgi:DUF2975 family protein